VRREENENERRVSEETTRAGLSLVAGWPDGLAGWVGRVSV